jgi:hypothetical protein
MKFLFTPLEQFERFAFVTSVLEHYSERDCALFLGCSPQDVRRARVLALQDLVLSHLMFPARDSVTDLDDTNR